MKILLIEDDEILQQQLQRNLEKEGFQIDFSLDGEDGLFRAQEYSYDAAIVDLGLPKIPGMEIIKILREKNSQIPILILTARSSWQDKVMGLKAGADDYLVKPCQIEELIARLQAMLRRSSGYASSVLKRGPITLNLDTQEVYVNGNNIFLTAFEYKLLQYFMLHPKRISSKLALADYLYKEDTDPDSNVIEVLVARLRQKLDADNTLKPIETLRGRGYRLSVQEP